MEAKKIVLFVPDARSTAPRPAGEFNDNNDVADHNDVVDNANSPQMFGCIFCNFQTTDASGLGDHLVQKHLTFFRLSAADLGTSLIKVHSWHKTALQKSPTVEKSYKSFESRFFRVVPTARRRHLSIKNIALDKVVRLG